MSIKKRLDTEMKDAMKQRDKLRLGCIRMLKSRLLEREVALRGKHGKDYAITDEEALTVISTYAKQRRDSIESYRQGGRDDLVAAEEAELAIVTDYLPQQLSADELRGMIQGAISESGAESIKDLGKVMKIIVPKTKGAADGKLVNQLVRELLAGDREEGAGTD
jgi:uncharacterized protein YqeY